MTRPGYNFECVFCGSSFVTSRSDARFCEKHRAPWRRMDRADRPCTLCGRVFSPKQEKSKYCGSKCQTKAYNKKRQLQRTLYQRHRAAKIKTTRFLITDRDLQRLRNRQEGHCFYCPSTEDLTVEHLIPVSRGGVTSVGNIVLGCRPCNSRKGSKTLTEYRKWCRISEFRELLRAENFESYLRGVKKDDTIVVERDWPLRREKEEA